MTNKHIRLPSAANPSKCLDLCCLLNQFVSSQTLNQQDDFKLVEAEVLFFSFIPFLSFFWSIKAPTSGLYSAGICNLNVDDPLDLRCGLQAVQSRLEDGGRSCAARKLRGRCLFLEDSAQSHLFLLVFKDVHRSTGLFVYSNTHTTSNHWQHVAIMMWFLKYLYFGIQQSDSAGF